MPRSLLAGDDEGDSSQVVGSDFLSPLEHTAIGGNPPHHGRGHSIHSAADHTDILGTPTDLQELTFLAGTSQWAPKTRSGSGLFSALPSAGERGRFYWATDRKILYYDDGSVWYAVAGQNVAGGVAYANAFNTATTDSFEHNSTSWITISSFTFFGTNVFTPIEWGIVGSRPTATGTANVRLVDFTNASNVIATIDFTAAAKAIYTTTSFTNLSVGRAVWELQAKKDASGSSKINHHSMFLK